MEIPFKTHLLHLLNFFRATDHIFEVTEKEKKRMGKKTEKKRKNYMYIWTKLQRQVPLHFKKNWRKFAAWSFWKSESHLNKWPRFEVLWRLYIRPVILRIFSLKWELIATVSKLSFYQSIWWIEYTVKSLQKSVQGKIGKFISKLCHAIMRQNFALKLFKVKAFWKHIEKTWAFHWKKY